MFGLLARRLAAVVVLAAPLAGTVSAQVRFAPFVGYDADIAAPSAGLGIEVPLTPTRRAFTVALRPSGEVVFAPDEPVAVPFAFGDDDARTYDVSVARAGVDVVGRYTFPGTRLSQYAKAGVGLERTAYRDAGTPFFSETNLGATLGLGVEAHRLFAEATAGTAAVSTARFSVGVRF